MAYRRIAAFYELLDLPFEVGRYRALRPVRFAGLSGTILDAGVGTGRNMPVYPQGARAAGIDPSPAMLARARRRRDCLGLEVALEETDVLHTSFPDHAFDTVVASSLFCVLPPERQAPALRELARIFKPGGRIRILEYAYSQDPFRRLVMRLWAPWVRWAYGAAFDRATEGYLAEAGLQIVETRFLYKDVIKLIVARPV